MKISGVRGHKELQGRAAQQAPRGTSGLGKALVDLPDREGRAEALQDAGHTRDQRVRRADEVRPGDEAEMPRIHHVHDPSDHERIEAGVPHRQSGQLIDGGEAQALLHSTICIHVTAGIFVISRWRRNEIAGSCGQRHLPELHD